MFWNFIKRVNGIKRTKTMSNFIYEFKFVFFIWFFTILLGSLFITFGIDKNLIIALSLLLMFVMLLHPQSFYRYLNKVLNITNYFPSIYNLSTLYKVRYSSNIRNRSAMYVKETDTSPTTKSNVDKTPKRILSQGALKRLDRAHSYVTFFLIGSFFGLALGNSIEMISEFPDKLETVLGSIDLDTIYIIVGSSLSILGKIIFSLR